MDMIQGDHRTVPLVIDFRDIDQLDETIFHYHQQKKEQELNSPCSFYISGGMVNCQPGIEIS